MDMGTRSRWLKKGKAGGSERTIAAEQQGLGAAPNAPDSQVPPAPSQTPAAPSSAPTIRKGVYLSALVYVEGDMPAPQDFMSPATSALKEALSQAFKDNPGGFSMTLKKVEVQNNVE